MNFVQTALIFIAFSSPLCGEVYMGINYGTTLGKVHELFPTAKIEKMGTAWAQKSDALYSIKGDGISGVFPARVRDRES